MESEEIDRLVDLDVRLYRLEERVKNRLGDLEERIDRHEKDHMYIWLVLLAWMIISIALRSFN